MEPRTSVATSGTGIGSSGSPSASGPEATRALRRYARITRLALWALALIVVTGGAVRLTGSGLGCSDWPACENDRLVASLEFHPLVEFVNRLFTGVVSVAVAAAVLFAHRLRPRRRDLVWLAWGLVAGVVGQIVLGGLLVLAELDPRFTIGHFLLSMVLVANAVVLDVRSRRPAPGTAPVGGKVSDTALARLVTAVTVVGTALLVTGTIVTGTGPHGGDDRAARLPFRITEVARIHSLTAIGLLALTALVWHRARRVGRADLSGGARLLAGLLVVQGAVGYLQYFTGVPVVLVGIHIALATATWIAVVRLHLSAGPRRTPDPVPAAP
ncbi:MAG: heme A synthase [Actinomyces sp.]|nr:MAG: heme A synthase [Actinomyces sp.]